jgi:hypothetical protein
VLNAFRPDDVDRTLLQRFREQAIGADEWTHTMHIRVGWLHLRSLGSSRALDQLRTGIRKLNEANGVDNDVPGGYSETITRLWLALIEAAAVGDDVPANSSADFVAAHPELLDFQRTFTHYRGETLDGEPARTGWVEPDLAPLP